MADANRHLRPEAIMDTGIVIANGNEISVNVPCTIDEFLISQNFPARSVVVEQNGQAIAPSEFRDRNVNQGDRLEIVQIVAGG